jgi:epsilon-lactone hydrolase
MLRLVLHILRAFVRVAFRRVRRTASRLEWSFGFETLVEALRTYTAWLGTLPFTALRMAAANLAAKPPPGTTVQLDAINGVTIKRFSCESVKAQRTILYLHGGGYVFGSADHDAGFIGRLALSAEGEIVAPNYRLAPESPCPAAIEDSVAVYEGLLKEGRFPERISFVGLSSGAGLVLAALQRIRDSSLPSPRSAVLLSPLVDCTATSKSWTENAGVDWANPETVVRWARAYAGDRQLDDPNVSPLWGDMSRLPPVLIVAGERELVRDDAKLLAEKMRAAGTSTRLRVESGMIHAFMTFDEGLAPAVSGAMKAVAAFVKGEQA